MRNFCTVGDSFPREASLYFLFCIRRFTGERPNMKYVEVTADAGSADTVSVIAESHESADFRVSLIGDDVLQAMRLLVADDKLQLVLDSLQKVLGAQDTARIVVLPVEIALPHSSEAGRKEEDAAVTARESLYNGGEKNARLDLNFLVLVFLSTIVAAIGLIESNVAVVIAPLLSLNLAFGLGTALGDAALMRKHVTST